MSLVDFKKNKEYIVPGKNIYWKITNNFISLEAIVKYIDNEIDRKSLHSNEFGDAKEWCFEMINEGENITKFKANWEIRRVKYKMVFFEAINKKIAMFATDRN